MIVDRLFFQQRACIDLGSKTLEQCGELLRVAVFRDPNCDVSKRLGHLSTIRYHKLPG